MAPSDGWVATGTPGWPAWATYRARLVAVTVESAPEPGSKLTDYVASRLDPAAPPPPGGSCGSWCAPPRRRRRRPHLGLDHLRPGAVHRRLADLADQAAEVSRLLTGWSPPWPTAASAYSNGPRTGTGRHRCGPPSTPPPAAKCSISPPSVPTPDPAQLARGGTRPAMSKSRRHSSRLGRVGRLGLARGAPPAGHRDVLARLLPRPVPQTGNLLYRPYRPPTPPDSWNARSTTLVPRSVYGAPGPRTKRPGTRPTGPGGPGRNREKRSAPGWYPSRVRHGDGDRPGDLSTAVAEVEAAGRDSRKSSCGAWPAVRLAGFSATLPGGVHPAHLAIPQWQPWRHDKDPR